MAMEQESRCPYKHWHEGLTQEVWPEAVFREELHAGWSWGVYLLLSQLEPEALQPLHEGPPRNECLIGTKPQLVASCPQSGEEWE